MRAYTKVESQEHIDGQGNLDQLVDLPEQGRDAYLSWLHAAYVPAILERPGVLWAAHYASVPKTGGRGARNVAVQNVGEPEVPTGDRYILMFGAQHAHVFGNPTLTQVNAGLPDASRKMLAMRIGERVNVMTEAARVEGPAAQDYPPETGPAPCIQLGSYNYAWQEEEDMLAWYAQWRMPAMQTLPGMVRTRRFASVSGWAKHAILYEWTSQEARNQYFSGHEDGHPEMKAWSDRIVPKLIHAPGSSNLASRIWPV